MSLLDYKCPNCGGGIQFKAGTQELVCPYCDSIINIEALQETRAEPLESHSPTEEDWGYQGDEWRPGEQDGMVVYSCNSCSGEIVADQTLGATSCPFCGNPVVMTAKFAGSLRPDLVIPFQLDKNQALAALEKHYLGKRLLPEVFKNRNHLDEVKGVYVPFWLFDAEVDAQMEYQGTRVRAWSDRTYNYTETSFYRIDRYGRIAFDQIPVDGSEAIDNKLMESIEPFDMSAAVDFQTAYLAGYFANKYDVDSDQCVDIANERVKNSTIESFAQTVTGYSSVRAKNSNLQLENGNVRYALLPVWLLGTSWQEQKFTFAMNGQTGKFVGDLPLDKKAYWRWFFKIFAISAGVTVVLSQIIATFI